jgi:hypothetical protein
MNMSKIDNRKAFLKQVLRGKATQAEVQRELGENGVWKIRVWEELPDGRVQQDDTGEILTKEELRERLNNPTGEERVINVIPVSADDRTGYEKD